MASALRWDAHLTSITLVKRDVTTELSLIVQKGGKRAMSLEPFRKNGRRIPFPIALKIQHASLEILGAANFEMEFIQNLPSETVPADA